MEIKYIREFVVLAELGNYVAAADELYISQPSLTKHIKALESELGVSLFDRTTRKVRLNRFGRAFLPYAEQIVKSNDEATDTLSKLSRDVNDTLHLGVIPAFFAYSIQEYLVRFKSRFPNYSVTLQEGTNDDLLRWVSEGRCNIAIVRHYDKDPGPQFAALPLAQDALVAVVPIGHPFDDGRTSISAEELRGRDLLATNSATEARLLKDLQLKTGIDLRVTAHLGRTDSIIKLLEQDFGIALLMKTPTQYSFSDRVRILDLEPQIQTTISLVYAKNEPLNSATRNFIKIVFPDGNL